MTADEATGREAAPQDVAESKGLPVEWRPPRPEVVPRPTYWPSVLAAGICFGLWGLLTSVWLIVVGSAATLLAVAGWLGDVRHDENE